MFALRYVGGGYRDAEAGKSVYWEVLYGLTTKLDLFAVGEMLWQLMTMDPEPLTLSFEMRKSF